MASYARASFVDDGLPEAWGDLPDDDPPAGRPLVKVPGDWRLLTIALSADERVALIKLSNELGTPPEHMAALLVRFCLREWRYLNRRQRHGQSDAGNAE